MILKFKIKMKSLLFICSKPHGRQFGTKSEFLQLKKLSVKNMDLGKRTELFEKIKNEIAIYLHFI